MTCGPCRWVWQHFMALMQEWRGAIAVIMTPEGRRAWAMVALWGAGMTMTAYAMASLWLVRRNENYSFWLGVMAHISIMIVITALAGLLVKRTLHGKITGVAEFGVEDEAKGETTTTATVTTTTVSPPVPPAEPPVPPPKTE